MTPTAVTPGLLHHLVTGSHAEGTTCLAVAAVIDHHDSVLLVNTDHCWELPTELVLPGEPLDDAIYRTAAAAGVDIGHLTGYLGHRDLLTDDDKVRTFVFAATTHDPDCNCHPTERGAYRWAPIEDLPDGIDSELLAMVFLAAPAITDACPDQPLRLTAALRAHARGLPIIEAAVELLVGHRFWLGRVDFVDNYVDTARGLSNPIPMAWVDWPAAITALDTGALVCSSGEAGMLRIAAGLADGVPVNLHDALTSLDDTNLNLIATSVLHAGRRRPQPLY